MQQQIDHLYASLQAEHPLAISAALKDIQVKVSAHYFDFIKNKNIIRLSLKHSVVGPAKFIFQNFSKT